MEKQKNKREKQSKTVNKAKNKSNKKEKRPTKRAARRGLRPRPAELPQQRDASPVYWGRSRLAMAAEAQFWASAALVRLQAWLLRVAVATPKWAAGEGCDR